MEGIHQPCENCGGLNFEFNGGQYHCTECQMLKEDVQNFEEPDIEVAGICNTKTVIKKEVEKKDEVKLTTWECYNVIIKGLVEELLGLGADMLLRSVVKKLWFKYLLKLEVVNEKQPTCNSVEKPKLQAVNTKIDAEIVYGRSLKRKKAKTLKSLDNTLNSETSISTVMKNRKKKKLFSSHHETSLSKTMDNSQISEGLGSLKSESQLSGHSSLRFNKYAEEELKKRQSEKHLLKHSDDAENNLSCHRISYRETSKRYQNSCHLLSINKIYSLLYLGLLLTKSKVQLADMLRFIREGHLSFNNFKHFFTVDVSDAFLTQICRRTALTSGSLRESCFQLAKFLNVVDYIEVQDLASLIEKFCKELNLPGVIEKRALSCLVVTLPKMQINENTKVIPNYEARALSLILFQIKMFFSLDGKTEKYLSEQADVLNNKDHGLDKFNFMKWLQYIDYRKNFLGNHHFPTEFASNKKIRNCDSFVKFLISKKVEKEETLCNLKKTKKKVASENFRILLTQLKDQQSNVIDDKPMYFEHSFSPSIDYIETLLQNYCINGVIQKKVLQRNFRNSSLDFISNPSEYMELLSNSIKVQLLGINKNIKHNPLINLDTERTRKLKNDRKFRIIRVGTTSEDKEQKPSNFSKFDMKEYSREFEDSHDSSARVKEFEKKFNSQNENAIEESIFNHSVPYESYWVNTHYNLGLLSKEMFEDFFSTYPYNFQFVVKEMARICEQNVQELLEEFSLTEIFLLYAETYNSDNNDNFHGINNDFLMKRIVSKAKIHW